MVGVRGKNRTECPKDPRQISTQTTNTTLYIAFDLFVPYLAFLVLIVLRLFLYWLLVNLPKLVCFIMVVMHKWKDNPSKLAGFISIFLVSMKIA